MLRQKTMSVRMDADDVRFVNRLAKEDKEDASKEVRKLVDMGRLMLGIEKFRARDVSLGKAAEIAGLSISEMMNKLSEYGIPGHLTYDDYLAGIEHLKEKW